MTTVNSIPTSKKLIALIPTIIGYCIIGAAFVLFFVPVLLLSLLPARYRYDNRVLFWFLDKSYKAVKFALLRRVPVYGQENMPRGVAIIAANHSSALDIFLLGALMNGRPHIWYVLEYYSSTPVLGFFVRRLGIFVDRENPTRAARALINGIRLVAGHDRSTIIFPEGGRFNDDSIHPFFEGCALIAKKTGEPLIPVFLFNAGRVYPPGSFFIYRDPVNVTFGPAMSYLPEDTPKTFTERVYQWFVNEQNKHLVR